MALASTNPTTTKAWEKLSEHFLVMQNQEMKSLFLQDANRAEKFHVKWNDFLLDFSKNRVTEETIALLVALANEMQLDEAIASYFSGDLINATEKRAVLHTALRSKEGSILVEGKNIVPEIQLAKKQIKDFSNRIINGNLKGFTNKAFTDVVNIGIGGSDLGPAMVTEALQHYKNHLNIHFVSNIDGDHVLETIKNLNPETTLFIVVSKTFTTQETITNALTVKEWLVNALGQKAVENHFVAVSANLEKVKAFGINSEYIFPMWDWVGGRFSLWSPVGLSIALTVGYNNFEQLLEGAYEMDLHFKSAPFNKNIPVVLALLSIWYNNFFETETEAVIPYTQYLQKFVPYLQQAAMESNGKSIDRSGEKLEYQSGNIVWGQPGTNSQHAFFQLVHQGTKLIPTDFIGFKESLNGNKEHHDKLMANFFAQTEALLMGKSEAQLVEKNPFLIPFKIFSGNKPTNTLLINKLTPKALGSLIAMYEHKIFVQGVVWNIFSFDQWGVELGKQLANSILEDFNDETSNSHDGSTSFLLRHYLKRE